MDDDTNARSRTQIALYRLGEIISLPHNLTHTDTAKWQDMSTQEVGTKLTAQNIE
ncbi:uncharacterized protein ARMOST_02440 [Armillaria ostoyae]|uniref:Uncharacterized protein n=1 Tax=Armillaria ostoyae TaxID=47428 RepID=A0A284QRW8_ARMOS|nr:uncharacterized protein ARMOST_02440 [Armillaria ostoyae]